ncbi:MAG: copper chaperone [Alphaproteobacteria bacterium HGW-Alphaproteobacteria-4]|jgi:copper chaperone|nr:MAG: copper chaperone [Alphaproteobacteria bacterium HGW-Alphaproteobacteria-4]
MTRFDVPDMSCGHCSATITKAIGAADAGASVDCDLATHTVTVAKALLSDEALVATLKAAGYAASPLR